LAVCSGGAIQLEELERHYQVLLAALLVFVADQNGLTVLLVTENCIIMLILLDDVVTVL